MPGSLKGGLVALLLLAQGCVSYGSLLQVLASPDQEHSEMQQEQKQAEQQQQQQQRIREQQKQRERTQAQQRSVSFEGGVSNAPQQGSTTSQHLPVPLSLQASVADNPLVAEATYSLLEVFSGVQATTEVHAGQFFELIEDPLLNLLVPVVVQILMEILRSTIISVIVEALAPTIADILAPPMAEAVWPGADPGPMDSVAGKFQPSSPATLAAMASVSSTTTTTKTRVPAFLELGQWGGEEGHTLGGSAAAAGSAGSDAASLPALEGQILASFLELASAEEEEEEGALQDASAESSAAHAAGSAGKTQRAAEALSQAASSLAGMDLNSIWAAAWERRRRGREQAAAGETGTRTELNVVGAAQLEGKEQEKQKQEEGRKEGQQREQEQQQASQPKQREQQQRDGEAAAAATMLVQPAEDRREKAPAPTLAHLQQQKLQQPHSAEEGKAGESEEELGVESEEEQLARLWQQEQERVAQEQEGGLHFFLQEEEDEEQAQHLDSSRSSSDATPTAATVSNVDGTNVKAAAAEGSSGSSSGSDDAAAPAAAQPFRTDDLNAAIEQELEAVYTRAAQAALERVLLQLKLQSTAPTAAHAAAPSEEEEDAGPAAPALLLEVGRSTLQSSGAGPASAAAASASSSSSDSSLPRFREAGLAQELSSSTSSSSSSSLSSGGADAASNTLAEAEAEAAAAAEAAAVIDAGASAEITGGLSIEQLLATEEDSSLILQAGLCPSARSGAACLAAGTTPRDRCSWCVKTTLNKAGTKAVQEAATAAGKGKGKPGVPLAEEVEGAGGWWGDATVGICVPCKKRKLEVLLSLGYVCSRDVAACEELGKESTSVGGGTTEGGAGKATPGDPWELGMRQPDPPHKKVAAYKKIDLTSETDYPKMPAMAAKKQPSNEAEDDVEKRILDALSIPLPHAINWQLIPRLRRRLHRAIHPAVVRDVSKNLPPAVQGEMKTLLPSAALVTITRATVKRMTDTMIPALVRILVPSLTEALSRDPAADVACHYCATAGLECPMCTAEELRSRHAAETSQQLAAAAGERARQAAQGLADYEVQRVLQQLKEKEWGPGVPIK